MEDVYRPGQVGAIIPFIRSFPKIEHFLLGGPADGNEAQVFVKDFPSVKVFGFEPSKTMYEYQLRNGFPGMLLNIALWSSDQELELVEGSGRTPRDNGRTAVVREGPDSTVRSRSLDSLSEQYGPFTNSVLWIDIEGSEEEALKGARALLTAKHVKLINLEAHIDRDSETQPLNHPIFHPFLEAFGFREVKRWNGQRYGTGIRWDLVFKLEK